MHRMNSEQYDSALQAIINYARAVKDTDKIIEFVEDMQTKRRKERQKEKTGEPLKK